MGSRAGGFLQPSRLLEVGKASPSPEWDLQAPGSEESFLQPILGSPGSLGWENMPQPILGSPGSLRSSCLWAPKPQSSVSCLWSRGSLRSCSGLTFSVPPDFSQMLRHYTTDGFRVLALACKALGMVATFEEALRVPRSVPALPLSSFSLVPDVSPDALKGIQP